MRPPLDRSYAVVTRNPTRAHIRRTRPRVLENMPDPALPHGHEQRRSAIPATDGRVEPAANGEFRRRLHDVVDHAALPYGYTLAAGSGSAVLATAHGRFGTVQALLLLLGAGFALIALIAAGRCRPARCPPPDRIDLERRSRRVCAGSGLGDRPRVGRPARLLRHRPGCHTIYFAGAAARASMPFRWLLRR